MSLPNISTQQIDQDTISALEASFGQSIPVFPKAFLRVISKVFAGQWTILYKYCGWQFLQLFVQTASAQPTTILGTPINPLGFWGGLVGVSNPNGNPATAAEMVIAVNVINVDPTKSLSAGKLLICSKNNVTYQVAFDVPLGASTINATITAVGDQSGGDGSGTIGNLSPGDEVDFANPSAGYSRATTVSSITVTATDAEDPEALRARILSRFQKTPQGGAYADYDVWGSGVSGIVNVYPYTGSPGEVDIFVEADVASSGSQDGIPTSAQLAAVLAAINSDGTTISSGLPNRRPVNAIPNVNPISRIGYDVAIHGFAIQDSSRQVACQADIRLALQGYFWSREPYIEGLSTLPDKSLVSATGVAGTVQDVLDAYGATASTVILSQFGAQVQLNQLTEYGQKAKLNLTSPTYPNP